MKIEYVHTKDFDPETLRELFESVGWESARFPEKLVQAMAGSSHVVSAWAKGRLVGLMNALDDGALNAYFHYLLVHPDFQHHGIGRELVRLMKDRYAGYMRLILIAVEGETGFYHNCGFRTKTRMQPMFFEVGD